LQQGRKGSKGTGHSGAERSEEPGIHTPQPMIWIPGSRALLAPRNDGGEIRASIIVLARHIPSEVCQFPSQKKREAERRQALGCIGTLGRATQARRARSLALASPRRLAFTVSARRGTLASRRSTAAVYWRLSPPGRCFRTVAYRGGCPTRLARLRSQDPLVVAGGRCRSSASRATVCMHSLAGRRIPSCFSNASRKHPRRTGQPGI
jgi:hypothetical protein